MRITAGRIVFGTMLTLVAAIGIANRVRAGEGGCAHCGRDHACQKCCVAGLDGSLVSGFGSTHHCSGYRECFPRPAQHVSGCCDRQFLGSGLGSESLGLRVDQKWGALEEVGLTVGNAFEGKNILLIDDMYQSGSTAHFVGSKLRAAGVNDIHLLAVSKGRRDTDNRK